MLWRGGVTCGVREGDAGGDRGSGRWAVHDFRFTRKSESDLSPLDCSTSSAKPSYEYYYHTIRA